MRIREENGKKRNGMGLFLTKIAIATACTALIFNFALSLTRITSGSMDPTLSPGDVIAGSRLAYAFSSPKRGDVVAFRYPADESQVVIKRIVGLPGETVKIEEGKIYVNGSNEPIDEPYLTDEWTFGNDGYVFSVPENSYFMLGDSRDVSLDSRFWAEEAVRNNPDRSPKNAEKLRYVAKDEIISKIFLRILPVGGIRTL